MGIDGSGKMTRAVGPAGQGRGNLALLRTGAMVAVLVGAAGSSSPSSSRQQPSSLAGAHVNTMVPRD
jgi:hypothetical protein